MAAGRKKVGKGKARKRSAPQPKQSRPRQRAAKRGAKLEYSLEELVRPEGSPVKSPPSAPIVQSIEQLDPDHDAVKAREILEKLQPAAADRVTTRRRRFIEEYLISGNGTEAARIAGFSFNRADVEASELLKDPIVGAEISRRQAELNAKLQITQERVLSERAAIAFSDMGLILSEDPDTGSPIIRKFAEWPPAARKAIRSIKVKRVIPKKGEAEQPFEILEFNLWDKPSGLDTVERRLDSEKGANAGVDLANLTDKERLRIIAEVLSRGRAARDAVMKGKKKTA